MRKKVIWVEKYPIKRTASELRYLSFRNASIVVLAVGVLFLLLFAPVGMMLAPEELFEEGVSVSDVRPPTVAEQLIGAGLFFGGFVLLLLGLLLFLLYV